MQSAQCPLCRNYLGDLKCKAFPEGIPGEFATGEVEHNRPVEGQRGRFVFAEGEPAFLRRRTP